MAKIAKCDHCGRDIYRKYYDLNHPLVDAPDETIFCNVCVQELFLHDVEEMPDEVVKEETEETSTEDNDGTEEDNPSGTD